MIVSKITSSMNCVEIMKHTRTLLKLPIVFNVNRNLVKPRGEYSIIGIKHGSIIIHEKNKASTRIEKDNLVIFKPEDDTFRFSLSPGSKISTYYADVINIKLLSDIYKKINLGKNVTNREYQYIEKVNSISLHHSKITGNGKNGSLLKSDKRNIFLNMYVLNHCINNPICSQGLSDYKPVSTITTCKNEGRNETCTYFVVCCTCLYSGSFTENYLYENGEITGPLSKEMSIFIKILLNEKLGYKIWKWLKSITYLLSLLFGDNGAYAMGEVFTHYITEMVKDGPVKNFTSLLSYKNTVGCI